MSLLMLLIARTYAPLGRWGALIEGQFMHDADAFGRVRAPDACNNAALRPLRQHARATFARDAPDALAA
jgi:hypothetical protein